MEPHDPYFVHPYNGEGYARVSMPNPDPSLAEKFKDVYCQEVRFFDEYYGKLLDKLRELGLYDNTMIVFTADHGEEFYEHGGWWHGTALYEEQIHVPLLVKLPGNEAAGTNVSGLIRTLDVPAMILRAAGVLYLPETWQGIPFGLPPNEELMAKEIPGVFSEEDFEGNVLASYRTGKWKLIKANEGNPRGLLTEELFDLESDPGELKNLGLAEVNILKSLGYALKESVKSAISSGVERETKDIDREIEQLRKLGYVE